MQTYPGQLGPQLLWGHQTVVLPSSVSAPEVCHTLHHAAVAKLLAAPALHSPQRRGAGGPMHGHTSMETGKS